MNDVIKRVYLTLIFTAVSLVTWNVYAEVPSRITGATTVTAEELIELTQKFSDLVVIDARSLVDRGKGIIESSVSLPNTETTPAALQRHVASKQTPVVFYCNGVNCGRSALSIQIALKAGYDNVYWFRGGWDEWIEKGYPIAWDKEALAQY